MAKKTRKSEDITAPGMLQESAVAYHRMKSTGVVDWNPNFPVHATQEEWWDHIHEIEKGPFMSWEEHKKKFEAWEKNYLASRLK